MPSDTCRSLCAGRRLTKCHSNRRNTANYRMWSSASLTAPSSGLHSCFSKSDCSCCLALPASVTNSRRVRNVNLQTSQYAVFGVLPMNLTILSFRSGTISSLQGIDTESTAFSGGGRRVAKQTIKDKHFCFCIFSPVENCFCLRSIRPRRKRLLDSRLENVVNKPASGLVRFSYKLSAFQMVGLVICRPETTGV